MASRHYPPVEDRFSSLVCPEPMSGCWLWTGLLNDRGYGKFFAFGQNRGAHRVSFFLSRGRWPEGETRHKCDVRACVNPEHMTEGSHLENMRDARSRGRLHAQRVTVCPAGHPYDERNTYMCKQSRRHC